MTLWQAITSFGDSALLLPLIAWTGICLLVPAPQWRDVRRWGFAVATAGGIVCLSKLLFMAWGIGPPGLNYTGFSGHTTLAILVWPSLGALLARDGNVRIRRTAIAAGCLIGAGVAVSRLVLKVHSPSEVWLGALLGTAVMAWFVRGVEPTLHESRSDARRRILILALGAVAIFVLCYGRVFPSQHVLKDVALWLSGHSDVFTRRIRLDSP
ncbi:MULTISPECIES: phosphatase PAP2 family protein [Luteibacter]|uniref:phosphatase PAP2 family protein n=1 Tax=Luteibacter TaxID=242605 RepID=UPI000564F631|nr:MULTISPECIES: phosphatase PAP2 family protein [unclassified Luteibacter]